VSNPLVPGSWIGIVGGGQLGRMLAMSAQTMGYRVCILDADPDGPAAQVADDQVIAPVSSLAGATELARRVSVVTYEFENIEPAAVEAAEAVRPVYPSSKVLRISQHRIHEKEELAALGCPVPAFYAVRSESDLIKGLLQVGLPAVLKTATMGYDGKGQAVIRDESSATAAFSRLSGQTELLILEQFIDFTMEISVVAARSQSGEVVCFFPVENIHKDGILDVTIAPARIAPDLAARAEQLASQILTGLNVVGVMAVEMFVKRDGQIMVNELAPRPHNSGHYSIDACVTSQFEQQVRVLCGLPLGTVTMHGPAVMVNLLGDIWEEAGGTPNFAAALALPGVKLHLYGKEEARRGRKMGHLTVLADQIETALERATAARMRLVAGR